MSSFVRETLFATDASTHSSILYAVLAAVFLVVLQPVLSIASPVLSRYPRLHLQRRVQHIVSNLLLAWLCTSTNLFSRHAMLLVLSAVVVLLLFLQSLRRRYPSFNSAFVRSCGSLLRPHELHSLPAGFYNLLSDLLCAALNEMAPTVVTVPIVRLSLLYEAVGDPMAAIIGTVLSPQSTAGKTAAGSVGMLMTCSAITALYLVSSHSPLYLSWLIVPPAFCALAERYTGRERSWLGLDDNFTVPVITCIAASLLQSMQILPTL